MGIEIIFLILAVLVIAFGVGVVVLNRRREGVQAPSQRTAAQPAAPPRPADELSTGDTLVEEPAVAEEPVAEEPPAGTLRERLAKARSTFAGAISGVLSRSAITDESFDELEEALLRADIGVNIADELLGGLRARVRDKEITEPEALLDALDADMKSRLAGSERSLNFEALDRGRPQRLDVRRRQRRRQDDHDRQARQAAGRCRPHGAARCRRHVPRRSSRAADHLGGAQRCRDRARRRRSRTRARSSLTASKEAASKNIGSFWPTPLVVCTRRAT